MRVGQTKKISLSGLPAEIKWNGKLYMIRVPAITSQFLGVGKTIKEAKADTWQVVRKIRRR